MATYIAVSLAGTTVETIDRYRWGNVEQVGGVIVPAGDARPFVILKSETEYHAESQRDRLASGLIGARIVGDIESLMDFIGV